MNKPQLRFKKYNFDWSSIELGIITNKVTEKNVNFEFKETFTNSAEYGVINQLEFFNHDISNSEKINGYYIVRPNDFVYNPRISSLAPVGPINRNKLNRTGVMSPLYTVFRPHDIDNSFLEYYFKTFYWHKFMFENGDVGARSDRFSIKDDTFFTMNIPNTDIAEQKDISLLMQNLDTSIELYKRKVEKMKNLRNSFLKKMFPYDNNNKPDIRFKGFEDNWDKKNVSQIFKITRGYVLPVGKTSSLEKGKNIYPVFSSQTLNNGLMGYYSDYLFENAITWTTDGANAGTVNYRKGKFYCTNVCGVLLSSEEYSNRFTAEAINNVSNKYVSRVGNPKLMNNVMAEIEFKIPINIKEREKISDCFDEFDKLIELYDKKVNTLSNIRNSILHKLYARS